MFSELWPIYWFQNFTTGFEVTFLIKDFCWILRCEIISHPNINLNVMTNFKARIELLCSKISNSYNLHKRYYKASISIIERVNGLFTDFRILQHRLWLAIYLIIFGTWFYLCNLNLYSHIIHQFITIFLLNDYFIFKKQRTLCLKIKKK